LSSSYEKTLREAIPPVSSSQIYLTFFGLQFLASRCLRYFTDGTALLLL